jgi:protein TonB
MKRFSLTFYIILFLSFFQNADAQKYAYLKADVYLLKLDFTNAEKISDAIYLLQVVKHSDTEYVCRYYNLYGPMLKQESFLDSGLSMPNGPFLWYDAKGILDSEAAVYRGRKLSFTAFDDSLKSTLYIKYRDGSIYEKRDYIANTYTDSAGNVQDLAEKEKAERNSFLQFKKAQTDTNQIEASFPGGSRQWNKYVDKSLLVPDRFEKNSPDGIYHATVSFCINKEGKVVEVILLHSLEWSADLEIFRTFENSPLWKPAVQFGHNVIYRQKQNLGFSINH